MYTKTNYRSGKALKDDFKAGNEIQVYQPNDMFGASGNGEKTLEGPHYPEAHRWYLRVLIQDFKIVKILN